MQDKRTYVESDNMIEEQKKLRATSAKLTRTLTQTKVPPVLSYVAKKAELQEVTRQIAMWTNHTKTAEAGAAVAKRAWRQARERNGAFSAPPGRRSRQPMDESTFNTKRRQIKLVGTIDMGGGGPQGFSVTPSGTLRQQQQRSHSARASGGRTAPGTDLLLPAIF